MSEDNSVLCCPRCKRPVEAKDFMNRFYLGATDSILQRINCRCGYNGLPISLSMEDYVRWKSA
ncbi:MAG TPA: hypothetical protein VLD37_03895 [Candidatus Bilamarchaeum sp.]|nr:hypothetical protein [Candidatus Bilamarchaeum sp.]